MTSAAGPEAVPSDGGPLAFVTDLHAPVLSTDDHHHLARVRRLRDGDPMVLADGCGRWRRARFAALEPEVAGEVTAEPVATPPVGVAFALVKGGRPELAVQKLTELGVDHVHPFVAARSVVRWDPAKAASGHARLERVAREAAMQSRRATLPVVHPVVSFAEVAALHGACRADRGGWAPSLDRPLVLVGPEGGWDDAERGIDLPVVALGTGVLRAETAAIAAGVVLTSLRAGLVQPR